MSLGSKGLAYSLLLLSSSAAAVLAQPSPAVQGVVILDLRGPAGREPITQVDAEAKSVLAFPRTAIDAQPVACADLPRDESSLDARSEKKYTLDHLNGLITCATGPSAESSGDRELPSLGQRLAAAELAARIARKHQDQSDLRLLTSQGDALALVVLQRVSVTRVKGDLHSPRLLVEGRDPALTLNEQARATRLESDLKVLAHLAAALAAKGPAALAPEAAAALTPPCASSADPNQVDVDKGRSWATAQVWRLGLTRSSLAIEASLGADVHALDLGLCRKSAEEKAAAEKFVADLTALRAEQAASGGIRWTCPPTGAQKLDAVRQLGCELRDPDLPSAQKVSAAEALGTSGQRRALIPLLDALQANDEQGKPDWAVRAAAARALGALTAGAAAPVPGDAPAASAPTKAQILTGPAEHWYLSADVPLTSSTQLTFDQATGTVEPASEPSTFYVGVNFMMGDLESRHRGLLSNVVVKGLIKASKRPLDSLGIGLALRGQYLKKLGLDFDLVSPFVAMTFTKEDRVDGTPQIGAGRNSSFRFGIALNLDKALGWVKGGS